MFRLLPLHVKEFSKRWELMQQELTENPDRKFVMIKSPSSGEIYTLFRVACY